jgi:epidermal growth factor receptor substrate 15
MKNFLKPSYTAFIDKPLFRSTQIIDYLSFSTKHFHLDDAKNRLTYVEKEFEQLKHDYSDLNTKQKELLNSCKTLEDENRNLLQTIEQLDQEKLQLKEDFEKSEQKSVNEITQLNELIEQQRNELNISSKQTDEKQNLEALQIRIHNYENAVSQYEEYRLKLENNLQKITQQRDTYKMDLRLAKEMLTNKENEFNQTLQAKEAEYHERFLSIETEKTQLEQRLQEANRALNLADSHLKQEIEKIKTSLEQEYNRLYERNQKQHQHDLHQLKQQLTNEFNKQRSNNSAINQSNISLQDIEEIKKLYRTEIDRLYRENLELSQHQSKLIDAHQKQMQIMKKDLDNGYNKVINELKSEQIRLQTRCDHLKQQLNDTQQTIEELKLNLNQLKTNHYDEILKVQEVCNNENRNRQDNLQNRFENLVKLLEQSNDA